MFKSVVVSVLLVFVVIQNKAYSQSVKALPRVRVVTPVECDLDEKLFERLQGQTSDLPIELHSFKRTDAPVAFGAEDSLTRCGENNADVIIWASPKSESSWSVGVTTCTNNMSLIRHIETAHPAIDGSDATLSGALETAALVLRGALDVLSQGGELGILKPKQVETQPPSSAPSFGVLSPPTPRVRNSFQSNKRVSSKSSSIEAFNLIGWGHSWDGGNAVGRPALYVAILIGGRYFQAGLGGSFGFGTISEDPYTELTCLKDAFGHESRSSPVFR